MDKRKEIEKNESELETNSGWVFIVLMTLILGWGDGFNSSKIKDIDTRVAKLEAKNEIIEKLITK